MVIDSWFRQRRPDQDRLLLHSTFWTCLHIGVTFLRNLTVLHPEMQQVDGSDYCIRRIAQKLLQIIDESNISSTVDEWKLYKRQSIPDEWHEKEDGSEIARLDHCWSRVFEMKTFLGA